jgi:hypothetical protein
MLALKVFIAFVAAFQWTGLSSLMVSSIAGGIIRISPAVPSACAIYGTDLSLAKCAV